MADVPWEILILDSNFWLLIAGNRNANYICQLTHIITATLHSRCRHYILQLWFLSSFFFFSCLFSAVGYCMSTILTHDVASVRIYNAGLKCAARGSLQIQGAKIRQKNCHLHTIAQLCRAISSQLRHVLTTGKTSGYAMMVHGRGCNAHRCTTTFAKPGNYVIMTSLMTS